MTFPRRAEDTHDAAQDTFDFKGSQRRAQNYLRTTLKKAKRADGMSGLSRDHVIAMAAVGGYLIAPTIAGIRKHRRKRRKPGGSNESTRDE